jgi:hypothetical protein
MTASPPENTTATPTLRSSAPRTQGHHLRASADLTALHSPLAGRGNRPYSEIFLSQAPKKNNNTVESTWFSNVVNLGEQLDEWEKELQNYEATLQDMANAHLDMKEELGSVKTWFLVLSEAERTAALYLLLQQTTTVQIRFFAAVLQEMAAQAPVNQILSPATFDKGFLSFFHVLMSRCNASEIGSCIG